MPTSATGASERRHHAGRRGGFTLIELLVVVVIVAALVAAAALSLRGRDSRALEQAALRAEVLMELACERAALTGRDLGISLVADGLRFGYLVEGALQPLRDDPADPLRPRALGEALRLTLERDGEVLAAMDEPVTSAQIACFSSGEMTPFTLELERAGSAATWRLQGRLDASLELERIDDR